MYRRALGGGARAPKAISRFRAHETRIPKDVT
jgi:hypothetical protein